MRRWVWDCFCLASLVVMVLGVGVWVRSYWVGGMVSWAVGPDVGHETIYGVIWNEGTVGVVRLGFNVEHRPGRVESGGYRAISGVHRLTVERSAADRFNWEVRGFQVLRRVYGGKEGEWRSEWWGIVPGWGVLGLGVGPGVWWGRRRKLGGRGFGVVGVEASLSSDEGIGR